MNRREIFKLTLGLSILSFISKFFIKVPESSSRIDVVFTLPENMSFTDYKRNVKRWVDADKFEIIQKKYQSAGHIISIKKRKVGNNRLHNTFHFSDDETLMKFIDEISSQCNYNFQARESLGVQTTSYINGELKNFYQLKAFKG